MDSFTDHYATLGVESGAPASAVKAAFKKLALQYHPDVYKGEDADERIRVLLLAYKTLNDPELRKQYDARRSEYFLTGRASSVGHAYSASDGSKRSAGPVPRRPRTNASEVSPSARRDRQRHYDFPDMQNGRPVHIDLIDTAYTLSAGETRTLQQQGMLRGIAPEAADSTYYCHRCRHRWQTTSTRNRNGESDFPRFCPKCHASDWPEYLLLRCIHCSAVFESEQIRYEIGSYTYGNGKHANAMPDLCPPYELFPLCPYCGTARWCPAEDARVEELRLHSAKRAAMMRMVWIGVTVFAIVVLGVIALGIMH